MARVAEPNFLKAWRERRRLMHAELGDAADTTRAVISLLEAGVAARPAARRLDEFLSEKKDD